MRILMFVLTGLLLAAVPAAADNTIRAVAIGGVGMEACSAWVADMDSPSKPAQERRQQRVEWLAGFFSGVNQFSEPSGSLHGSIDDPGGMFTWIDNYCREHRNDSIFIAASDFVLDLRNHPRQGNSH